MFRPTRRTARRGQILIVVLAMLTILAIVGITFTSYTSNLAHQKRIEAEAQAASDSEFPDDGMTVFNYFLGSFIYDVPDDATGVMSALRGHSLMATMYGRQPGSITAFNGVGNFDQMTATAGVNRRVMINFKPVNGIPAVYFPEYTDESNSLTLQAGQVRVPKNAPYTYPDINNLFLASICPATGEVLVPSYHRDSAFGPLDLTNTNWTSAQGKYLTLRPRPNDNVIPGKDPFPYPSSRTGDVQNLMGGPSGNDSIWIDIGAPVITTRDGKRYKPLVAPLVVDLNNRLNPNVHGNLIAGGTTHTSGAGIGPWEVNLARILGAEAQTLINNRYNSSARTQSIMTSRSYAPRYPAGSELPRYAQVPWSGLTGANALLLPGAGGASFFATEPTFSGGYSNVNTNPGIDQNHPSLYNPTEWPSTVAIGQPRTFPVADTKLLNLKYAFSPGFYKPMELGQNAVATLGTGSLQYPTPYTFPIGAGTQNRYRTDPAHMNRQLFTTYAYTLDRMGVMPESLTSQYGNLGPIDLNRTLADYRNLSDPINATVVQPLSPNNCANYVQADLDRQNFAMDIFARLILATGATGATVDTTTGVVTVGTSSDALRHLAQLAANIVDYIDTDDVCTRFQWSGTEFVYGVERPRLVLNEVYSEATNDRDDQTFDGSMPVKTTNKDANIRFWIELLNPTSTPYTTNGPLGTGAVKLRDSFSGTTYSVYQIEIVRSKKGSAGVNVSAALRDPTNPGYATNPTGAIVGTTADIVFDFSPVDVTPALATVSPANGTWQAGSMVTCAAQVLPPQNGNVPKPEFNPNFAGSVINANAMPAAIGGSTTSLTYPLPLSTALTGGMLHTELSQHVVMLRRLANPYLLPGANNPLVTVDFIDNVPTADHIVRADGTNTDRMEKPAAGGYDPKTGTGGPGDARPRSVGKLQPYASWTDTVTPATLTFPNSLVVKQSPVADTGHTAQHTFQRHNGIQVTPPAVATYTLGLNVLSGSETLMTPFDWLVHLDRPLMNPLEILHVTAGRPYELTQQFITPNVLGGAATDVVKFTGVTPVPATTFGLGTAAWFSATPPTPQPLYRALEALRIQPYGYQNALGGRLAGPININTIQDKRIWDALFDAYDIGTGVGSQGTGFTQAQVNTMWDDLIRSRSPNGGTGLVTKTGANLTSTFSTPIPGASVYDMGAVGNYDRPFLPLGAPTSPTATQVAAGLSGNPATVFGGGVSMDDTILRRYSSSANSGQSMLSVLNGAGMHPYQQNEAARKVMNNITTVSNSFAVWVTVGYFEITNEQVGTNGLTYTTLGKEFYRETPGDTRFRFFSVVDRSQVGLNPQQFANNVFMHADVNNGVRPFFTTVEANTTATPTTPAGSGTLNFAAAGSTTVGGNVAVVVYSDGVPVTVTAGSVLVIGQGANAEIVQVDGVTNFSAATATTPSYATVAVSSLTLPAGGGLKKPHSPGECVSNIIPGNPGPQPSFDVNNAMYQPVVPLWARVP